MFILKLKTKHEKEPRYIYKLYLYFDANCSNNLKCLFTDYILQIDHCLIFHHFFKVSIYIKFRWLLYSTSRHRKPYDKHVKYGCLKNLTAKYGKTSDFLSDIFCGPDPD